MNYVIKASTLNASPPQWPHLMLGFAGTVFSPDKSEAYGKWLGQNGLINVLGQLGAYTDDKGHLHRGKFILPSREEYDTVCNMHLHKRTKGLTEGPLPAMILATPY